MPLFFMISGYVHGMKERFSGTHGYWYYVSKNFIELYLPCMYFSLLLLSSKLFTFHFLGNTENFPSAELSSLYHVILYGTGNYWFLRNLFFVKIFHLLFERFIRNENIHTLVWIILFIITSYYGRIIPEFIRQMSYGLYFHSGFFMKRRSIITYDNHPGAAYGIMLFLVGILFFSAQYFWGIRNIFTKTLCELCVSLAVFVIFYALRISNAFLILCGIYSMVIYIPHNNIIAFLRVLLRLLGLSSSFTGFSIVISGLLFFAAALLIPLVIVWLYKNVKCLRWIEYIFYPGNLLLRK